MKVKELINRLKNFNSDLEVKITLDEYESSDVKNVDAISDGKNKQVFIIGDK